MPDKPNILLIHADQLRYDCLGVNGHPFVQTPNLDRLAEEGATFRHAYSPSPICSPARACLLTGQWSFQHGCVSTPGNEIYQPARDDAPVFSTYLADAGYRLGWVGKFHQEVVGTPLDHGFGSFIPESRYGEWRTNRGLGPQPKTNRWFGETDTAILPEESRIAWGASEVLSLLDAGGDEPFFIRWDPSEPHLPNVVPEPFASLYNPKTIPPWPNFTDDLRGKPYIQAQQRRTWGIDHWTWDEWAPIVGRYLGEITLLDTYIGRLLDRLDERGIADSTMVIFSVDHGDLCGAHGMIDKHFVMYDEITRVPLIVRYPGHIGPFGECENFVSHEIDIARTILTTAGIKPPESFRGKSLFEIAAGTDPSPREDIFSAWHGAQLGAFSQRMVRGTRWKYVWNATAEDELYDLETDPGELRNLATTAPDALRGSRARLVDWMESLEDPILNYWTRGALERGSKI